MSAGTEGEKPFIICLAGPNGAGKSTFYEAFLSGLTVPFVNADRIASSLLGERQANDYEAAKIAEEERQRLVDSGASFIMETVFSDPNGNKPRFLIDAERKGYFVALAYIGISSPAISAARVDHRVKNGGHGVPPERLIARYERSLDNLVATVNKLSMIVLYDNSGSGFKFVAECVQGLRLQESDALPAWARRAVDKMSIGGRPPTDRVLRAPSSLTRALGRNSR